MQNFTPWTKSRTTKTPIDPRWTAARQQAKQFESDVLTAPTCARRGNTKKFLVVLPDLSIDPLATISVIPITNVWPRHPRSR